MGVQPFIMGYHTLLTLSAVCFISVITFGAMLWILKFEPEDKDFLAGLEILKNAFKKGMK